jgi:hypothetical protein
MKKLISLTMMGVLAMGMAIGLVGCSDEAGTKTTQVTTGSDGSKTKVTSEQKVETSGSNPPAPATKP